MDIQLHFLKIFISKISCLIYHLLSGNGISIIKLNSIISIYQIMIKDIITKLKFDENGLIPAIAQNESDNKILMMAWMNQESIEKSISEGYAIYFSRSRNKLWKKGETSGNLQKIISITADCDYDSILLKVKQVGVACHTGKYSCFFNQII